MILKFLSPQSSRQYLSYGNWLEDKVEDIRIVLCCIVYHSCTQSYAHAHIEQFLQVNYNLLV